MARSYNKTLAMTLGPGCSRSWEGLEERVHESWKDAEGTAGKTVKKAILGAEKENDSCYSVAEIYQNHYPSERGR